MSQAPRTKSHGRAARAPFAAAASLAALAALAAPGCEATLPEGLAPTPGGSGPRVVFDFDARPLPDVPFPNDLATRPDSDSPTGRRVNASLVAPTSVEARTRARVDELDGFSTFAAISVRFDAPLDPNEILARHGASLDDTDDVVYVVNLATGETVPLDVGGGAYAYVHENPSRFYPNDPRAGGSNLIFETFEEDLDGDGVLDPGEDTDSDGVLDHPNVLFPGGDPVDDLLTFYERETDTFIFRPLVPLVPESRYAVILTRRLVGVDGEPVRSPFAWVNHTQQTEELRPLLDLLPSIGGGLSIDDVAFVWSFTTQSTTRVLEDLRMGLYGEGPFWWLEDEFPAETALEVAWDDPSAAPINPYVVSADYLFEALAPFAGALLGAPEIVDALVASYQYADYLVLGRSTTPLLLHGLEDAWDADPVRGTATVTPEPLPWLLTVPKERPEEGIVAPFPVAIYVHGTGGDRLQSLGFAGQLAKWGIATIGIDSYAHGLVLPEGLSDLFLGLFANSGLGPAGEALLNGRTVDVNGDGVEDPAGDFWSYDAFHTRDTVRQAALDVVRLIHVLRGFDGKRTWSFDTDGDGTPDLDGLAGDFDGDGDVDLVGPGGPYFVFGISLGGIVTSVVPAIEPAVVAAAPIATGGGLIDISVRSLQQGLPEAVLLPAMGPLILGMPDPETGDPIVGFYLNSAYNEVLVPVHAFDGAIPGDVVRATNLRSGEERWDVVDADLRFRIALPVDIGDPIRIDLADPETGTVVWTAATFDREITWQGNVFPAGSELLSLGQGLGLPRQSPEFRRLMQIAQMAVDPGDPVNYAPHWWNDPLFKDYEGVGRPVNVAVLLTAGDMNVPIGTGVALARAAGLVPFRPGEIDPRYGDTPHRVLIDNYVVEGLERLRRFEGPPWNDPREIILDADWLAEGADGFGAPLLSEPMRLGADLPGGGRGVMRLLYVETTGHHGIAPSDPRLAFDVHLWGINAIGRYFASLGTDWPDDVCLATDTCSFIPTGN